MQELSLSGQDLYDLMVSFLKEDHNSMKIQCRGNSMAPFIRDKNILTLAPLSKKTHLQKGDIVVAAIHKEKRIIIHRIISTLYQKPNQKQGQKYLIKGDNNKTNDGWFHQNDIIGTIQKIETGTGLAYCPKPWQNLIIALGSKYNVIKKALLPGLKFLKESQY